jgi:triacylglycerol lipase
MRARVSPFIVIALLAAALTFPASALANCDGDGGGGTWEWEWGEGGSGGTGGTGGSGGTGGTGGTAARDPILFVHGWRGYSGNFATFEGWFKRDGWLEQRMRRFSYTTSQSNKKIALLVQTEVNGLLSRTGATKVDIITHSMGGLSSRWYLKTMGGTSKVDEWVSLAGPNHGTETADFCTEESCIEMRRGSTFLNELNATDETPGSVRYGTWRSPTWACETVILPSESTILSGAVINKLSDECLGHEQFLTSERIYKEVKDFVG